MSLDISRFKAWLQPKYFAAVAVVVVVVVGTVLIYQAVQQRGQASVATSIKNGDTNVSVTRDVVIDFPHENAREEDIQKHFAIYPNVQGEVTFDGTHIVLTHEKNLEYATPYVVRLSKGILIASGSTLPEDIEIRFVTQTNPSQQKIPALSYNAFNSYSLDAYSAKPSIALGYYGTAQSYRVQLFRSSPEQYVKAAAELANIYGDSIATQDYGKYYDAAASIDDRQLVIGDDTLYEPAIIAEGIYMMKISSAGKEEERYPTHIFVVYTKIAEKSYRLGDKFVSRVIDQRTGTGVKGAEVIAYDAKSEVLFKASTDATGVTTQVFAQDEKTVKPALIETRAGNSVAFTFSYLNSDSYYKAAENVGHIYTDRPLYSPGDTVHFKGITRPYENTQRPTAGKQFTVTITQDNYGSAPISLYEKNLAINANGTFADSLKLTKELKSGSYQLSLKEGDKVFGTGSFSVEYYQKPDFAVGATLDKEAYVSGQKIKVVVKPTYYFGGAVTNGKVDVVLSEYGQEVGEHVTATLGKNGATIEVPTKGVSLNNGWWYGSEGTPLFVDVAVIDGSGRRTTESKSVSLHQGEYSIVRTVPEYAWYLDGKQHHVFTYKAMRLDGKPEIGRELTLTIKKDVWNSSEEEVKKNTQTFTYKTDAKGEFTHTMKFSGGGYYVVDVEGTDSLQNKITNSDYYWVTSSGTGQDSNNVADKVFISLDKKEYKLGETAHVTVELPNDSGDLFWSVNKKSFKKLSVQKINEKRVVIDVAITEDLVPGFYFYADLFHNERFISATEQVKVIGKILNVKLNAPTEKTQPGEKVSVGVYTTDEKGLPVAAETSVSVVDKSLLALKSELGGSIYDALYPMEADELRTFDSLPAIGSGSGAEKGCFTGDTQILMVGGMSKAIKDVRAGDRILTRASDFSNELRDDVVVRTFVHQVDEYLIINGVLNVTAEHRVFVSGRWMQIGEAQIGDWLIDAHGNQIEIRSIEQRRGSFTVYNFETAKYHTFIANGFYVHNDKGGGGNGAAKRTNFVDTAYWNAFVTTDEMGNGMVSFTLPDNTTTWAVRSKGISIDGLTGDAKAEFLTTKPVIVRPVLPEFVRVGDVITIVGAVHNSTGNEQTFKTLMKAVGATIQDSTTKDVKVKNGEDAVLTWRMVIGQGAQLKLSMSAVAGDKQQDAVEHTIPVYESLSQMGNALSGNEAGPFRIVLTPGGVTDRATAKITIAPSVAAVLPDVIAKLSGFPYGCVEQTMSRHLPNILAFRYSNLGITKDKTKLTEDLNEGFDRLFRYQHSDGGFGWWETDENNVWMSGYVLEGLTEAKQAGLLGGREGMYTRLLDYLKKNLPQMKLDEQAYIAYALAKAEPNSTRTVSDSLGSNLSQHDVQGLGYIALASQLNGNKELALKVVREIKSQMKDSHWEFTGTYDYHGALKDRYSATGVNLLAISMIQHDEAVEKNIVQWLMQHRTGYDGLWGSTRQSSQILYALVNYLQNSKELSPSYSYTVTLNGVKLKTGKMSSVKDSAVISVPAKSLKNENSLVIIKSGAGNIFWTVQTAEFLNADALATLKNDMPISREYLDEKGNIKTEFAPGEIVTVRLKFTPPEFMNHYLMAEDYLPAALRPFNSSLENEGSVSAGRWWWYDEMDIRDQKVAVFRTYVSSGQNVIEYKARVLFRGTFAAPAPVASFMYEPEVKGFGVPATITVK